MDNSTFTSSLTISYRSQGTVPPVFVAGSFTEPAWAPIELKNEAKDNGEYHFRRTFQVSPGVHQYKFRLGHGDWWICDESRPTGNDGRGNTNNIVTVKPTSAPMRKESLNQVRSQEEMQPEAEPSPVVHSGANKTFPETNDRIEGEGQGASVLGSSNLLAETNGHVVESSQETHESEQPGRENSSNISITGSQEPLLPVRDTMDGSRSAREKVSTPSLSTEVSFRSEDEEQERSMYANDEIQDQRDKQDRDMQDVRPSMLYRICSKILCGRSRKHVAVALTTILLPILAWYFYGA